MLPSCSPLEAKLSLWTRKEAALKAFGVGLSVSPSAIFVGPRSDCWRQVQHSGLGRASLRPVSVPSFAMALAARCEAEPDILCVARVL